MTTTTAEPTTAVRRRVPIAVRGAQLLLLVPLGAFQLVATIAFSIIMPLSGKDYIAAAWAPVMALACIVTALRLGRGAPRTLRTALVLLAAQTAFGLLKLIAFGETAALVFLAVTAACAGLLALPGARRHFHA
ncbi:hypothetical protein AB0M46_02840 [Dactylosporangium sp. NPDC051485]|uniref:hypothetical protein n=1 Tax=Dactylosporangium sp. NPDC051485 TaxID=3154846 RepID=UPI0034268F1A